MSAAITSFLDVWGAIVLYIAILTAIPPIMGWSLKRHLPSARIQSLEAALEKANGVFYWSLEAGLMSDLTAESFRGELVGLCSQADVLRLRVLGATTFSQDLKNMLRGLSLEISRLARDVDALRGRIAAISLAVLDTKNELYMCPQYGSESKDDLIRQGVDGSISITPVKFDRSLGNGDISAPLADHV